MNDIELFNSSLTRRHFFRKNATGLGYAALASLLGEEAMGSSSGEIPPALAQFAPKAKRAIYLSMIGAPRSSTRTITNQRWSSTRTSRISWWHPASV